ncbi:MAG: 16S rRNA (cytosine(1402)-N(4))-methyltransferase RsmH [SAR324 cluster bacterium]|nr:16S rRNA (cytosine(1402)-N(4))-methyltransferase RsmH [SAR324 cluster bacterium]
MNFYHAPVLLDEVISLIPEYAEVAVDFTLGVAGHSARILKERPEMFLWGIDQDKDALTVAEEKLNPFQGRYHLIHDQFSNASQILINKAVAADFILADLGVSSFQLDQKERGFSFRQDAALDMRMDQNAPLTAFELVNTWSTDELTTIIRRYGEDPFARKIALQIVRHRGKKALLTTQQLSDCIKEAVPKKFHFGKIHPATKTFQAIRIAVNNEIKEIEILLKNAIQILRPGGRMVMISFHSLEDRPIKKKFQLWEYPCQCSKDIPFCICGLHPVAKTLKPKLRRASKFEVEINPRSRSAKLRAIEKL